MIIFMVEAKVSARNVWEGGGPKGGGSKCPPPGEKTIQFLILKNAQNGIF